MLAFKGTGSPDGLFFFVPVWIGLNKGRGCFLNFFMGSFK
jgi:hypothetical protein